MAAIAPIYVHSGLVGDESVMVLSALTNSATVASDGSMTPVGSPAPGVSKWADYRSGIPVAYPSFTFSLRPPTRTSRVYKIQGKLIYPVLESNLGPAASGITPGPTKAYDLTGNMEFLIPERATLADREAFYSYLVGLMVRRLQASDLSPTQDTGSPIYAGIRNLEAPWA